MKRHILLTTAFIVLSVDLNAQNTVNSTVSTFQQVQNSMKKHYDYIKENGIFDDPVDRIDYYFKTIQTVAPELLCKTFRHKDALLNILIDSTFNKNYYSDIDVQYLLCNVSIDEYVDILNEVCGMYKEKLIDYRVFDSFLFQDPNVSNLVAKNYQNEKLNQFLGTLLQDDDLLNRCSREKQSFIEEICDLKDGFAWHGKEGGVFFLKEIDKVHPPILDRLNKECQ